MKQIEYISEHTFEKEIINIEDEHYDLAVEILNSFGNYGPLIVKNDKKSLMFAVNLAKNRVDREIGTNLYRITIEKIL